MSDVLIIVLNWNGEEYLEECLGSLMSETLHEDYQVLVVDNNSEDDSVEIVDDFPEVDLIENERNLGFSIGNNIGLYKNPGYDYYLLLNNDTEVKEGWLEKLLETFEEKEDAGICGPKLKHHDGTIQSAGINLPELESMRSDEEDREMETEEVDGVLGAAFMIKDEVIEEIGYLDEFFSPAQHEESDYCSRARKAGYKVYLEPDSEVLHYQGKAKESAKSDFMEFLELKNLWKFQIMNGSMKSFFHDSFIYTRLTFASILRVKPDYPWEVYPKALKETLKDLPVLVKKRFSRTEFVPSYYCEDIRDYSKRYGD
jgi:GT2 family glycosyltransferase